MSNLIPFGFEGREVRIVMDADGEPLFVAKDVVEALEYVWNGSARIEHVPEEWRGGPLCPDLLWNAANGCFDEARSGIFHQ